MWVSRLSSEFKFCPQTSQAILGRAEMLILCFQFLLSLPLAPVSCPNSIMIRGPHRAAARESPFLAYRKSPLWDKRSCSLTGSAKCDAHFEIGGIQTDPTKQEKSLSVNVKSQLPESPTLWRALPNSTPATWLTVILRFMSIRITFQTKSTPPNNRAGESLRLHSCKVHSPADYFFEQDSRRYLGLTDWLTVKSIVSRLWKTSVSTQKIWHTGLL